MQPCRRRRGQQLHFEHAQQVRSSPACQAQLDVQLSPAAAVTMPPSWQQPGAQTARPCTRTERLGFGLFPMATAFSGIGAPGTGCPGCAAPSDTRPAPPHSRLQWWQDAADGGIRRQDAAQGRNQAELGRVMFVLRPWMVHVQSRCAQARHGACSLGDCVQVVGAGAHTAAAPHTALPAQTAGLGPPTLQLVAPTHHAPTSSSILK